MSTSLPYWRLSAFYLFYFATVGVFVPFWGLYLEHLHFSPAEIGELSALLVIGKLLAPYIWGWVADHSGERMRVIRSAALASCLVFIGAFFTRDYWPLAVVMFIYGFFWSAPLPQFEAVTLNHLGDKAQDYTRIRVWGSIGFIVTVIVLGFVLDKIGLDQLPWIALLLTVGIWLTTLTVPCDQALVRHSARGSIMKVIRTPTVLAMLVAFFLMQVAHGTYYSFFSLYLEAFDYSRTVIGQLWALGVIAEVGLFLIMLRLLNRFTLRHLLLFSLACATFRWWLIAECPSSLPIMLFSQCLHAATFGIHHAVAIQLIHQYFHGNHQGRGQALYSSLSYGAGGALGALISGYIWQGIGARETFWFAAFMSLLGWLIVWRWVKPRP